jgi:hypothetical protein
MGTGQMLITIGAMMLLSIVLLRVNNGFLSTNTVMYNNKFGLLATSLATSVIEEASSKTFDEATDSTSVATLGELTPSNLLGPESGESYPDFDDFDDFNNYYRLDSSMQSAQFDISSIVEYVPNGNPDGSTTTITWHKKITVYVTSVSMINNEGGQDTARLSKIYSYWYFR